MTIGIFIAGLLLGVVLTVWLRRVHGEAAKPAMAADAATAEAALPAPDAGMPEETPRDRLYRLRGEIEADDARIMRPEDLLQMPQFREGVALLAGNAFDAKALLDQLESDSGAVG